MWITLENYKLNQRLRLAGNQADTRNYTARCCSFSLRWAAIDHHCTARHVFKQVRRDDDNNIALAAISGCTNDTNLRLTMSCTMGKSTSGVYGLGNRGHFFCFSLFYNGGPWGVLTSHFSPNIICPRWMLVRYPTSNSYWTCVRKFSYYIYNYIYMLFYYFVNNICIKYNKTYMIIIYIYII